MRAYKMCLALIFTASLACDGGVSPPDTPYPAASNESGEPKTALDPVSPADDNSVEQDTVVPTIPLNKENEFCLPFEMDACHSTTSQLFTDCSTVDCMCQFEMTHVKYAPNTAACLHLACPKHYPNPDLLASCYQDWFLSVEECFRAADCTDWGAACPDASVSNRLQFLRSCLGN